MISYIPLTLVESMVETEAKVRQIVNSDQNGVAAKILLSGDWLDGKLGHS